MKDVHQVASEFGLARDFARQMMMEKGSVPLHILAFHPDGDMSVIEPDSGSGIADFYGKAVASAMAINADVIAIISVIGDDLIVELQCRDRVGIKRAMSSMKVVRRADGKVSRLGMPRNSTEVPEGPLSHVLLPVEPPESVREKALQICAERGWD